MSLVVCGFITNAIAQGKQEIEDYQTHQEYVGNKMQAVKSKGTAPNKPVKRGM